jgi:hypothetical protein
MKRFAVSVVLIFLCACSGSPTAPTARSPATIVTATPPGAGPTEPPSGGPTGTLINVGQEIHDVLAEHGTSRLFAVIAPSDGTLRVQLRWDQTKSGLVIYVDDVRFRDSSPIVATLPVAAGRQYRLKIVDTAPWDYDIFNVPFTLVAAMA